MIKNRKDKNQITGPRTIIHSSTGERAQRFKNQVKGNEVSRGKTPLEMKEL